MSDITWSYLNIDFICDSNKRRINLAKHSIDLVKASTAFVDPAGISESDESHSDYEERRSLIAKTNSEAMLYIIYTMRGNTIRIISARKATKHEGKLYERR